MRPFIEQFLEYTSAAESPGSFFRWASYVCIAAVAKDNVWIDQFYHKVFPNIYVLLLAPSAVDRKSVPLGQISTLVRDVSGIKVIQGRTSIQGVLEDLTMSETDKHTGKLIKSGACLLCADEIAAFFVDDPALVKMLTDLYDSSKPVFDYNLKGTGKKKIPNPCVTMLAASNLTYLKDVYTASAIYGGLMGRTFFVKPDEFRPANSLFDVSVDPKLRETLLESLLAISKLKGKLEVTQEARTEYDRWYIPLHDSYKNRPDETGVVGRLHAGVLKIALILAIDKYDLKVCKCHIEEAIDKCMALLPNYEGFTISQGKSTLGEAGAILLEVIWNESNKAISRRSFLYRHWSRVDADTLDKLLITLEQAGLIKSILDNNEGPVYKMTQLCIDKFNAKLGG